MVEIYILPLVTLLFSGASSLVNMVIGTLYFLANILVKPYSGLFLRIDGARIILFLALWRLIRGNSFLAKAYLSKGLYCKIMGLGPGLKLMIYGLPLRKILLINQTN